MAEPLIELPFSSEEYAYRVDRVLEKMEARGLDLLLVSIPENSYYLTGFQTGSHQTFLILALPLKGDGSWIVRKTELSNIRSQAPLSWVKGHHGVEDSDDPIEVLASVLREMGHERSSIGIEQEGYFFNISFYLKLKEELPGARLLDGSNIVEELRRVKSESELAYMRRAGEITAKALRAGLEALHEGMSDRELARIILGKATEEGSEIMCAGPFITSGKRTFLAHSSWTGAVINRGDIVNTEMAAVVARYNTPAFRNAVIGEPSDEVRSLFGASRAGMEAGMVGIKPGMSSGEADRVVRTAVDKAGYGENFVVRAAYGIGLGFSPGWGENHVMSIRPDDPRVIEPGMCFHLVPALYKEGLGAVCCSMPIEIDENGCKPLTSIEPDLFIR
ncbi:MAG: aminopeptidase P family protein [Chloroflexi bacterium]|nr:aminopeptidase P family protein [Chloroflexota bacterium]